MKPLLSILIVEPSDIIIEGLQSLLDETGDFNVLAPLHDAAILHERLVTQSPDLLLINPSMVLPQSQQQQAILRFRQSKPVVALLYQYMPPQVLQGYTAVLDICENRGRVASLLRECCDTRDDGGNEESYELSDRETEVLVLLAQGCSSKEIAEKLHISIHTVNTHRKNITHKTGIKSVAGLAVYAALHNLIDG